MQGDHRITDLIDKVRVLWPLRTAVTTHEAAPDPHPGYVTTAEGTTLITNHEAAANPHPTYATDTDLTNHAAAADPHTGYAKKAGDTFTGQTNLDGNTRIGAAGTLLERATIIKVVYDPASLAANTSGAWAIPLPAGSCDTGDSVFFGGGITSSINLRSWSISATDEVTLRVMNNTGSAIDHPSSTFTFLILRVP